jgi:hypothetical protein
MSIPRKACSSVFLPSSSRTIPHFRRLEMLSYAPCLHIEPDPARASRSKIHCFLPKNEGQLHNVTKRREKRIAPGNQLHPGSVLQANVACICYPERFPSALP